MALKHQHLILISSPNLPFSKISFLLNRKKLIAKLIKKRPSSPKHYLKN
jgi:hypothetical protein